MPVGCFVHIFSTEIVHRAEECSPLAQRREEQIGLASACEPMSVLISGLSPLSQTISSQALAWLFTRNRVMLICRQVDVRPGSQGDTGKMVVVM